MTKVFVHYCQMLLMTLVLVTSVLTSISEGADGAVGSVLVVKFKAGTSLSDQEAAVAQLGGIKTSSIAALRLHVISIPDAGEKEQILFRYQSDPRVERVEIGKTRQAEGTPNDMLYDRQWALKRIGWDGIFDRVPSGSAIVAVLDTGVHAAHQDLGEGVVLPGTSMLVSGKDGRTDPNGHGTWLAGIIGAVAGNGEGIAGVCYAGVKILPVTVLNEDGTGHDGNIIAGIAWAVEQGADVILMGFSNAEFSQSLQDVIDYAWERGVVLVAAAGNAGVDTPAFPAGARAVMGISATTEVDTLLSQSNFGQSVFLAAPGENLLTTNSDVQGHYTAVSGTSASSAVVAGVAAFMKAMDRELSNGVIVGRLARSADAIGTPGDPANQTRFGNGRINMLKAVTSTDTDVVMPAGASPVGTGGPYVGPYATAASGPFSVQAQFSANTSTITAQGFGLNTNWIYQYAYEAPSGTVVYHRCTPGSGAGSDSRLLPSGFQTGTWKVHLLAYNPSYQTCLDNGTATKTATAMTNVTVTSAYMSVLPARGTYGGTVSLSASLAIGTPISGKTVFFTLNGASVGSAVTDAAGVATLYNVQLGPVASGTYPTAVGASFPGDGTYALSNAVGSLTVDRATPVVMAWPSAADITYGQSLSSSSLSGGIASVPGVFTFDVPAAVPNAGSYSAAVTFSPVDSGNLTTVSGTVPVTVRQAVPSVTMWPTPSPLIYGQRLSQSTLSGGSATVTGTFSYVTPAHMPNAGTHAADVDFIPSDANYAGVRGTVQLVIDRATPAVSEWPAASTISFGQPLSASTLSGGVATVSGTFSFETPAHLYEPGSYSVPVLFAPDDSSNYTTLPGSTPLMVTPASQQILFTTPDDVKLGVLPFTVTASATSGLPVSFSSLTPTVCTVSGATVSIDDIGACTIAASQQGTMQYYAAVPVTRSFVVNPGDLHTFELTGATSPQTAGVPFDLTVTAKDAWGHTITAFTGSVVLSTSAGTVTPAGTGNFTDGIWTGQVTVTGAGTDNTITARADDKAGTSSPFDVNPGPAVAFTVIAPAITSAGNSIEITVTAKDAYENVAAGYLGTIRFSTTDPKGGVTLPADYAFTAGDNGTRTFAGVVLETAGTQTISASDVVNTTIGGTSGSIAVSPAGAAKLSVSAPASGTAGTPFDVTVSVKDAYDNDIVGYTGMIRFTASDVQGTIPADYAFTTDDNGRHTFAGLTVLKTSGVHTISAVDSATPEIAGTSGSIAISPAAAQTLVFFQQPASTEVGRFFDPAVVVSLLDGFGNLATGNAVEVTLSLDPHGHSGNLNGVTTVSSVDGLASFSGIAIDTPGNGFMLQASSPSITPVTSAIFDIVLGTCGRPTLLTVPATNTTGVISLSWSPSDVSGATYVLEQSKDNGAFTEVYRGEATATTVTVTANGVYRYRVKAMKDGYNTSDYTAGSNGCNVAISCDAPASLTVPPANSTGTFLLRWSPSVLGGVTYVVEQSRDGGAFTQVYSGTGTSSSVTVGVNGSYSYRVRAIKAGYLDSGYTAGDTACIVFLACGKPASLTVPPANSSGTILLVWSASDVSGATYLLEQSRDGGPFTQVYSGPNTSASVTVTINGSYGYRVKAIRSGYAASDYTVGNTGCTVRLACKKPEAVNVPATNSTGTFWVTWSESDVSGATYILEQSINGGAFVPLYTGNGMSASVTVTANGTYSYRVKAIREGYESSDYTVGSLSCAVYLVCGKPASLTVPASNSTGTYWISWRESDVSGVTYVLEQSKDGGAFAEVYTGSNTTAGITVSSNGAYAYRVKALKTGYDTSAYTTGGNGCIVYLVCGKPAYLTVPSANSTGRFWISWGASDVSGVTYILEESKDGGVFTQIFSGTSTSASIAAIANGTYTYRVKAMKTGYDTSGYTAGSTGCVVYLACGKPASLTVPATNSTGAIPLSWASSDVSDATYVLEQSRAGGPYVEIYTGTATAATVTVTGNDMYTYRVKAMKTGYDTSAYTTGTNGCTVYLVCGKPASVTVPSANSTGVVTVSWSPSDVAGVTYILEQSRDGGAFAEVHSGTNTSASIAVSANGTYTYRVKAIREFYVSSDYTVGSAGCVVRLACGKPATIVVPAQNSTGSLSVSWSTSDVAGATYVLEQSLDGGTFAAVYNGTNTSAQISVDRNGTYTYRVRAIKANYESSDYTVGSTGCIVLLACGNPAGITVPISNSTGTFWVTWRESDVSGATYVLEQSRDGGEYSEVYRGLNVSASVAVAVNGTYSYRVKAVKAGYEGSSYTVAGNGCSVRLVCGNPASLTVPSVNSTGQFWLSWREGDVGGATYMVEQSKDGGPFVPVYSGTNTAVNVMVTGDGTYTYRVMAQKAGFESSGWTLGSNSCAVRTMSGVRMKIAGQDSYFATLGAAVSAIPEGASVALNTWATVFYENLELRSTGAVLTIGSAFDETYSYPAGPTLISGAITVSSGTLVADNLVIR